MNEQEYNKRKEYMLQFMKRSSSPMPHMIIDVDDFREATEEEKGEHIGCYYLVEYKIHIYDRDEDNIGYKYDYRKCLVDKKEFDKYVEKKEKEKKIIIWL